MDGYALLLKYVLFALLFWLLVQPGFKGDREWLLVEYSLPAKGFMLILFGFSLLLIFSATQAEKGPNNGVFVVLFLFSAICFASVMEAFRCKLWFDNE